MKDRVQPPTGLRPGQPPPERKREAVATLRSILRFRGSFGVLFGLYALFAWPPAQLQSIIDRDGFYALLDGLLGLALAFALSRYLPGKWLAPLTWGDALVRLAIGVVAVANPDLEARVLTAAVFFGAAITACITLGLVGVIYVLKNRNAMQGEAREGDLPALITSVCVLVVGIALAFVSASDSQRILIAGFALAQGLTLLVTGIRMKRASQKRPGD